MMRKKHIIYCVLLFVFVISLICVCLATDHTMAKGSSSLILQTTEEGNTLRKDFLDVRGVIVVASDKGYATSVITSTDDKRSRTERFYDEKGIPVRREAGYYAILREYDDVGQIIQTTYLDSKDDPINILEGYAIEKRTYNSHLQVESIKYYDNKNEAVNTASGIHGEIYKYDNEKIKKTYINCEGYPQKSTEGYASVIRERLIYDESKNIGEFSFYYDEIDQPVALSLGQYGLYTEYDENKRVVLWKFLDAEGNPVRTKKGYTSVSHTYDEEGAVIEQYYGLNDEPISLIEGQYGKKIKNKKTVYLDKNGNEIFNLKKYIYDNSWLIVIIALLIVVASSWANLTTNVIMMIIYIFVILYFTIMFRYNLETKRIEYLWYYKKIFTNTEAREDILKNIWLFVPLGAFLYRLYPKKIILFLLALLSIAIESVQYFTSIGICELDDLISNSIGGCIGFYLAKLTDDLIQRIKSRRHIYTIKKVII